MSLVPSDRYSTKKESVCHQPNTIMLVDSCSEACKASNHRVCRLIQLMRNWINKDMIKAKYLKNVRISTDNSK